MGHYPCCRKSCVACQDGKAPRQFRVVISGCQDWLGGCGGNCPSLDGTYDLAFVSGEPTARCDGDCQCLWEYVGGLTCSFNCVTLRLWYNGATYSTTVSFASDPCTFSGILSWKKEGIVDPIDCMNLDAEALTSAWASICDWSSATCQVTALP